MSRLHLLAPLFVFLVPALLIAEQPVKKIETDLLIVGGTESGCAAAVQAARMGVKSITLVNDIAWLGGQFSAEALIAIDENRGPDGYGHGVPFPRNGLFREVIDQLETHNLKTYGVARPGNTRVITTCRPKDAETVFRQLVAPAVKSGQLTILSDYVPVSASLDADGKTLGRVRFNSAKPNQPDLEVRAKLTIDASDWGDVIRLSGAAYEFGPDLQKTYGEPLAPTSRDDYPLTDMNPITYCMVLKETDKYQAIPKPANYDVRNYTQHPYPKDPLWLYASRRVIDHYHFKQIQHPDMLLLCFPAFDYPLDVHPQRVAEALEKTEAGASRKNIVELTHAQRQIIFDDAKQYSLGYLHYLQTTVHEQMPDKTHSFARFELTDEFGTTDRMPFKPYVRESLRLKAMHMMKQQETTGVSGRANNFATVMYHDGVASWQFEYDFHPTKRIFLEEGKTNGPWKNGFRKNRTWGPPYSGRSVFPLRSLVPEKIEGLLGAQKNLGYSSIVSSAVRLHDQSMAIGQAVGAVAAVSLLNDAAPRVIPFDRPLLAKVWKGLCNDESTEAVPATLWPFGDLDPKTRAFASINQLAIRGLIPHRADQVDFLPAQPATEQWMAEIIERTKAVKTLPDALTVPQAKHTRGEFAVWWWNKITDLPEKPFPRKSATDADGDGIPDADDALTFHSEASSWPKVEIPKNQDGIPPKEEMGTTSVKQFNFTGKASVTLKGWLADTGSTFNETTGYGWKRNLSNHVRIRNRMPNTPADSFVFTRTHDTWECNLPNGTYQITVCVGDAGHAQTGQNLTIEGKPLLRNHDTEEGWFTEKEIEINLEDGKLTVEIGLSGSTTNTCINWLQIQAVQTTGQEE